MGDYKDLAKKYLKANRGRSLLTILGVVITVIVLYGSLNMAYCYLLQARDTVRKDRDYEFVVMAETRAQGEEIAADELIEKAYIGRYEYTDWHSDSAQKTLYKNAVYATGKSPYRMEQTMNEISEKYKVAAEINDDLAILYFQDGGEDGSVFMVIVWTILLIAYIFAIFAVGIIRNTIQMFMMEQIKDYGILRCIGATKGQLKKIVYLMGAMLEFTGIIIGVVLGGLATLLVGAFTGIKGGYHLLPMAPVLICYLGDLYFVMRENCKVITGMSPISAVRGNFRIKMGRLKGRGKGLMGRIFGMEGAYARKSVLRNRGRLVKTVASLSVSIAALVAVVSVSGALDSAIELEDRKCGQYQMKVYDTPTQLKSIETVEAALPSVEKLQKIADNRYVTDVRKVYETITYVRDVDNLYSKLTDEFLKDTQLGGMISTIKEMYDTDTSNGYNRMILSGISFRGLDKNGLDGLKPYLVDGTVDVSDHGIAVVTAGSFEVYDEMLDGDLTYVTQKHLQLNTYKVGDTIDIVDTSLLFSETQKALKAQKIEGAQGGENTASEEVLKEQWKVANEVYDRLVAAGHYKTYTVEGILDMGDRVMNQQVYMYTSLDNYLAETGYTRNQISGMEYQVDSKMITSNAIENLINCEYSEDGGFVLNLYFEELQIVKGFEKFNKVILMIAALVFALGAVNIINATVGNLHMRRKEFAQLRVIGMSRKRLIKTVMLEGVMAIIWSGLMGIVIGTGVYYGEYSFLKILFPMRFAPSVPAIVIGIVLSAVLVCGSIYIPLKRLPQGMAEDLSLEE